jgi:hypothetical protein
MVVCLKHVGITNLDRERLEMRHLLIGQFMLAVHVLVIHLLCGLVNVDLSKGLTLAAESVITQSSGTAGALMHVSVLLASK